MFPTKITGTLNDGTAKAVPVVGLELPMTVWTKPASGDTVTVEYTVDGSNWIAWPNGAATSYSADVLDAPILEVRFTRTAGSGTTSAYGIL